MRNLVNDCQHSTSSQSEFDNVFDETALVSQSYLSSPIKPTLPFVDVVFNFSINTHAPGHLLHLHLHYCVKHGQLAFTQSINPVNYNKHTQEERARSVSVSVELWGEDGFSWKGSRTRSTGRSLSPREGPGCWRKPTRSLCSVMLRWPWLSSLPKGSSSSTLRILGKPYFFFSLSGFFSLWEFSFGCLQLKCSKIREACYFPLHFLCFFIFCK